MVVRVIAGRCTTEGNQYQDAVGNPEKVVGSFAGLGCATFERTTTFENGSVDRTYNGCKDHFGEEHDVEIKQKRRARLELIDGIMQMRESAVISL